jgi:hypothetical protein
MKNIVLLVIFVLGIVLLQYVQSHSVEEIIRKYLDARGGHKKLNAIRSVYMEGSREIMGTQIPVKVTIVQNKLYRNDFEFNNVKGYSIITPTEGWAFIPKRSVQAEPVSSDQVAAMQLLLDIAGPLADYKGKRYKAELQGKEMIDGKEAYKIKITLHNNTEILYYIDKETSLLIQSKQTNADDSTQEMITNYSDYKLFDGVLFPQTISNPGSDIMSGITTFDSIVIDKLVDESEYKPFT